MKKRFISWLLVLAMVVSLIPSTLITSAFAAGTVEGDTTYYKNELPNSLTTPVTDIEWNITAQPNDTITVADGQTLIVHGTGGFSNGSKGTPLFEVQSGGHLVLDQITIEKNTVGKNGAVYVHSGGLLDLGYNDQSARVAPGISGNTASANLLTQAAKNLVVADGATVRLNAAAEKKIGVTGVCADGSAFIGTPISVMEGGRYTIRGNNDTMANKETMIEADSATLDLTISPGSPYTDVNKTGTKLTLQYVNDHLVLAPSRINVLVWDPIRYWNNSEKNSITYDGAIFKLINTLGTGDLYGNLYRSGTPSSPRHMNQQDIAAFEQFDMIVLNYPTVVLNQEETNGLNDFLCNGGRIFMQFENPNTNAGRKETIIKGQTIANALKAEFEIDDTKWVAENANVDVNAEAALSEGLTSHRSGKAGYIFSKSDSLTWIFSGKTTTGEISLIVCDQNAGNKNGEKWGALTICGDGVYFDKDSTRDQIQLKNGKKLLENLLKSSRKNRLIAATGVNPNKKIDPQATTTTTTTTTVTPYLTPYAALQKAVETNTVTLQTASNAALTPTRDELLFERSTLAYETGSKYERSTIHADTAGVYLDITKTGEVNLYSGTVTVTPKDENYVLTMNGTMDDAGTQITGGYKITASNKYTLDADDETSKIPAAQGGGASITLENIGDSVTVEYGAPINQTVTYTAQEANEKIYLGYYRVDKSTGNNITWTDDDYAWHGKPFTTTAEANDGWELNGEKLTVADKEGNVVGDYELTKSGEEAGQNGSKWTVYTSQEKGRDGKPKVTVKQEHLGGNADVDRQGKAMVIVSDVRGDITIGAAGDFVSAASAFVYVVGIGRKDGKETKLWEYTTVRNSKDGLTEKPINGWPWEKWKVVEAGSARGSQSDYENKTDKFNASWESNVAKLNTTNPTATYTIDLTAGDQVVVFYYDWNMVDVTIKAVVENEDGSSSPVPDYTPETVELEIGKKTTVTAPNLPGYQPKAGQNSQDVTPDASTSEITFTYEKTTGNLTYIAVVNDDTAAGGTRELGRFSGGTLVRGQAPAKSPQYAPKFDNYELVDQNADGVASAESYNGTDITVTYTYQAKVKTIPIEAYVDNEQTGVRLLQDTTTYKDITTGQTITVTAPDIPGYKVKAPASQTIFVTNNKNDGQKVVFLYEKDTSNDAYVQVELIDTANDDKVIGSYQVPGVAGKAQVITLPAAPYGYKYDDAHAADNVDQTVTPPVDGTAPHVVNVKFYFVPNVHTVTIVLKDTLNDTTLTVDGFVDTYKVIDGESLKVTAPSIYGYTMAAGAQAVVELTNVAKDETVRFEYEPIDKQLVTIAVRGVTDGGQPLFQFTETVTHGTQSKDIPIFTIPGYKLKEATIDTDKVDPTPTGSTLAVDTSNADKGSTINVVLTYESNMVTVTVKAMYNNVLMQSYTTQVEKNVKTTVQAPSIPGYTAEPPSKDVTTDTNTTVEFQYTKNNGNITVVVNADGTELYRKGGGTVDKGAAIDLTGNAAAPEIQYYTTPTAPKSVTVNNQPVDTATYTYTGIGDVVVTYEYTRKLQTLTIVKKDVATGAEIENPKQTIENLRVGESHTFGPTEVAAVTKYDALTDLNPTSYFVEDRDGQTVTFWYKNTSDSQYVQVTVNLKCGGKIFQTYPVTAVKGVETRINAPKWTGYTLNDAQSKKITPNGDKDRDTVTFEYTIKDPKKVTIVLQDSSKTSLTIPTGYTTEYTLKEGDVLKLWAPAMNGYTLMGAFVDDKPSQNKQFVEVNYANITDNTTVTFSYQPVADASFVTHTIRFMVGTNELYSHEKMVPKGNGNQVIYDTTPVKNMLPGYAFSRVTYTVGNVEGDDATVVTDDKNATITYYYTEDAATITIKTVKNDGGSQIGTDTVLTGYRKGQTVRVVAPAVDGYALVGDLIQSVKLNGANEDVTFRYAPAGEVTFTLWEKPVGGTSKIIELVNGVNGSKYDPSVDGNPLNLKKFGYTYVGSGDTKNAPFDKADGKIDSLDTASAKSNYDVYYTKDTREVQYIAVNNTTLSDAKLSLDVAIANGEVDKHVIGDVTPTTPEPARVGESYKAIAQSFNGWMLVDEFSKIYNVDAGTDPLKVYFLYELKTTGTVTVHYHNGTKANKGDTLNAYTITAVAGEKVQITAPDYFQNNKYKLRDGQEKTRTLTVTANGETVDFYYEPNFFTVTVKTVVDGGNASEHEKHEVTMTTPATSLTLYPPVKVGYTLVGIDGNGLTNGGQDKLPDEFKQNALTFTPNADTDITYYYKTTSATEYQTALTIVYKYGEYVLAESKTIRVNKNETTSVAVESFDGYAARTYVLEEGTGKANGDVANNAVSVTLREATATLTITYAREDGSVVLPGKDGKFPIPDDKDNVTVTPDKTGVTLTPNGDPSPATEPVKGSVTVPDNTTATVTRPKDPQNPKNGTEDITVPGGTTINPNGTIVLPDGTEIGPDAKIPDALNGTDYVAITYDANNGTGEVKKEVGKTGELEVKGSLFTAPANGVFAGWNDNGSGNGKTYAKRDKVSNNLTLYAVWGKQYQYSANIIYKPNDGSAKQETQLVGHETDPILKGKLQNSPFQVSGWTFGGWNTAADGSGDLYQADTTLALSHGDAKELFAQWYKVNADGSIEVPGKDGNPKDASDNATAKGDGKGKDPTRDNATGEITIPKGGSVILPDGSVIGMPDGGKLLPNGTVIINLPDTDNNGKPDNTITVPGENGTDPDVKGEDGNTDPNATAVVLIYDADNGSGKTVKVYAVSGKAIKAMADTTFTYSGHKFLYWQVDATNGATHKAGTDITPTGNMTLFAVWAKVNPDGSIELPGKDGKLPAPNDEDNVIVTPDSNDGLEGPKDDGSVEVKPGHNATVTRPDPNDKPNKDDIKVPAGTIIKPDGTIILPEPKPNGTVIDPDEKFPDALDGSDYTAVTFEAGQGTGNTIKLVVAKNSDIKLLDESVFTAPRNHYFIGWQAKSDSRNYDAGAPYTVNATETFTAQYEDLDNLTKAVAIFDYAGGTDTAGNGSQHKTGKANTVITGMTQPTRKGYRFVEWDPAELKFGPVGSVTVFTATWTIETYSVTFANDDTQGTMTNYADPIEVEYGSSVAAGDLPQITANTGKVFLGWLNSADNSIYTDDMLANYKVTGNVTFTAQYATDSDAIVIFDYNGGTVGTKYSDYVTGTPGTKIGTIPTPSRAGYTQNGWTPALDTDSEFGNAGDVITYTANWLKDQPQTFTVTFTIDAAKGSTTDTTEFTDIEDGSTVPNVPVVNAEAGWTFVGWRAPNGKLYYDAGVLLYPITGNTKFTAEFVEITVNPGTATVIFDANGGKIGNNTVLNRVGVPGTVIGAPEQPTRPGYRFLGWSDGFNDSTVYGAADTATTYTAQWEAIEYTIHFSATGATGATTDQTYKFDGSTANTLKLNGFKLSGKQFIGWSLTEGAQTADYVDGALINDTLKAALAASAPANSITLYAVWQDAQADTLTVTADKSTAKPGETVDLTARINGTETNNVIWIVANNSDAATKISNGVLTIGDNETNGTRLVITAIYRPDTSLTASTVVRVVVDSGNTGGGGKPSKPSKPDTDDEQDPTRNPETGVKLPEYTGVADWLETDDHYAYMNGIGGDRFAPDANMTRAQVAQMFYNLLIDKNVDITARFTDVPADAWYATAVNTLASIGAITGIGNNQFAPNRTITRAEFTAIAVRFAKLVRGADADFSDVPANAWYYDSIATAVEYGWIGGYADGTFRPNKSITRAEVVTIVNRMLNRSFDTSVSYRTVTRFTDVPTSHWAFEAIVEATTGHDHYFKKGVENWDW